MRRGRGLENNGQLTREWLCVQKKSLKSFFCPGNGEQRGQFTVGISHWKISDKSWQKRESESGEVGGLGDLFLGGNVKSLGGHRPWQPFWALAQPCAIFQNTTLGLEAGDVWA